MTENLRIQGKALDSSDSDLPSGATFTLPASGVNTFCATSNYANCDGRANVLNSNNAQHPEYGTYYNWYAATAGYGKYATIIEPVYSICPKNWSLQSKSQVENLYSIYGSKTSMQQSVGPNYTLAGYTGSGNTLYDQGVWGLYWESTPGSNGDAYAIRTNADVFLPSFSGYQKYWGFPIRCVAK